MTMTTESALSAPPTDEVAVVGSPTLPLLRSIECVYLPVSNKKQAQDWYIEKGLLRRGSHDPQLADGRCVFLLEAHGGGTANFPTLDWGDGKAEYEMFAVTFEVDDIEAVHAHLTAGRVEIEPIQDHGGCGKGFVFFDPDGNKLCVWQRPARDRRPLDEIDHVQLPVPDPEAAAAWYRDHLGFRVASVREDHTVVVLERGPTIFLWRTSDGSSGNFSRDGVPWPQVGIRARDIARVHQMAIDQGLPVQLYEDHGHGMVLKFWDPFGNLLVLHQDLER